MKPRRPHPPRSSAVFSIQAFAVVGVLVGLLGACRSSALPESLANQWTFQGISLEEDGCQLVSPALMDGRYSLEVESTGDLNFAYGQAISTTTAPPSRFYCERSGAAVSCWPFRIPNSPRGEHTAEFLWQLEARLEGTLSQGDSHFEGMLSVRGICVDGTTTCTSDDPQPNPPLPCVSTVLMSGSLPQLEAPGDCPPEGVGSEPNGVYATITLFNDSGKDFEFGKLNTSGQRDGYWSVYGTTETLNATAEIGTWFIIGDEWDPADPSCKGAWLVDEPEEYFVVRSYR